MQTERIGDNTPLPYYTRVISSVILCLYTFKYKEKLSEHFKHNGQLMLCVFDSGFSDKFISRVITDIEDRIVSMG